VAELVEDSPCPLVLEIGCNDGDDSQDFLRQFERIQLHCFEPDPRPIAQFKARLQPEMASGRVHLHEYALGAEDGETTFWQSSGTTKGAHKQDWDLSGSTRKPTGHLKHSPWCKFDSQITVPLRRLDGVWQELGSPLIDFIWMDAQGGEGNVIAGGREALGRTRYVYTEYGHWREPLYDGQLNLDQTAAALGVDWQVVATYEGYNALFRNMALFVR
jgi:FkbM family methyltransferase